MALLFITILAHSLYFVSCVAQVAIAECQRRDGGQFSYQPHTNKTQKSEGKNKQIT